MRNTRFADEPRGAGLIQSGPLTQDNLTEMAQIVRQYKRDNPNAYKDVKKEAQKRAAVAH